MVSKELGKELFSSLQTCAPSLQKGFLLLCFGIPLASGVRSSLRDRETRGFPLCVRIFQF